MTAALLRNELFHHLPATSPERTRSESARAGVIALAFHAGVALLLLQIPETRPAIREPHPIPILIEPVALPESPEAAAPSGTRGGGIVNRTPVLVPPTVVPDVLMPPTRDLKFSREPIAIDIDVSALTGRIGVDKATSGDGGGGGGGNFIVVQNAPRMLNASHVAGLLRREYPPVLLQSGIGGTVLMHVLIDLDGSVIDARVAESSGIDALDAAALRVSREMRFSPARNRDQNVRVWAAIPVVFSARN